MAIRKDKNQRLWEKGESINKLVHNFTVGEDPEIDLELISFDALGSAAHALMLKRIGIISSTECEKLICNLYKIMSLANSNKIAIPRDLEDCHTAIENFLTYHDKESGEKIHTGRSRNDQVLLAMRLYIRDQIVKTLIELTNTAKAFLDRASSLKNISIPGYTHFQRAMPSSCAMWLQAFAETLIELIEDGLSLLERINSNPLGAASGFGSPIKLDREYVTKLLAFSRTQANPINIQNSRGKTELKYTRWAADIASVFEKFAWDMILYTSTEYGFFSLPKELTTGSSLMPQKHNPDVLELLRASASKIRSSETELNWLIAKLPSSYHRDFQYTKQPTIRCAKYLAQLFPVVREVVSSFTVNLERIEDALSDDLYATYELYRHVAKGLPFREAYRVTAKKVANNEVHKDELRKDFSVIARTLELENKKARTQINSQEKLISKWQSRFLTAEKHLFKTYTAST